MSSDEKALVAVASTTKTTSTKQQQYGTMTTRKRRGVGTTAKGSSSDETKTTSAFSLDAKTGALVLCSSSSSVAETTSSPAPTQPHQVSTQSLSKVIRQLVWNKYIGERNGLGTCWCCRNKTISAFEFEAGHVIPRAKGGPDTVENLRPICSLCNKSMGTENMLDYQKRQNLGPSPSQVAWEWLCNVVSFIPLRIGW
jgi:5-methylcytosine-specific restriction endonuclease McrA